MCPLSTLPGNRKILATVDSEPGSPGRVSTLGGGYFGVRFAASVIWSRRKSTNSIPCALSAFG
jgi:hypothetical protein